MSCVANDDVGVGAAFSSGNGSSLLRSVSKKKCEIEMEWKLERFVYLNRFQKIAGS